MLSDLFISFANAQLKEEPEYLDSFLEELKSYNHMICFQIAKYSEEELLELCDIDENGVVSPDPQKNILFEKMSDYAESKVDCFDGEPSDIFEIVIALLKSGYKSSELFLKATQCRAELNARQLSCSYRPGVYAIAIEGVYCPKFYAQYCSACRFNQVNERVCIIKKVNNCVACHQEYLNEIIDRIIIGEHLFSIAGIHDLAEARNSVITNQILVRESGELEEHSWISNRLIYGNFSNDSQQFSEFLLGCLGFSLLSFLAENKKNIEKIKKCIICNNYFIASKASKNICRCNKCSGKLTSNQKQKKNERDKQNKALRLQKRIRAIMKRDKENFSQREIARGELFRHAESTAKAGQ